MFEAPASESQSCSQYSTSSQSPSPSTSPLPISLQIVVRGVVLESASGTLDVSDANPPLALELQLGRCPAAAAETDVFEVACSATLQLDVAAAVFFAEALPGAADAPPACPSSSAGAIPLPQSVTVGLYGGAAGGAGTLTCEVSSGGRGLARASVPINATPALWPLWSDAILVSTTGLMRSAVLGQTVNATPALLAAACPAGRGPCGGAGVASALALPRVVLDAARATWGSSPLPMSNDTSSSPAFALTLVGPALLVLRASQRAFLNATVAAVGPTPARVMASSDDGQWLLLETPTEEVVCAGLDPSTDCGYFGLALANPAPGGPSPGFCPPITCPPFCPGELDAGVVPLVVNSSAGGLQAVPATVPAAPVAAAPEPLALPALSSLGIYYARACSATGLWTDPSTGACTNASDPLSYACAYGSGDACVTCPSNVLCPGGTRECWVVEAGERVHPFPICPSSPPSSTRCVAAVRRVGCVRAGRAGGSRLVSAAAGALPRLECVGQHISGGWLGVSWLGWRGTIE